MKPVLSHHLPYVTVKLFDMCEDDEKLGDGTLRRVRSDDHRLSVHQVIEVDGGSGDGLYVYSGRIDRLGVG